MGFEPRRAWVAAAILASIVALIIAGLMKPAEKPHPPSNPPQKGDWALYETIIGRIRGGEGYYPAAIDEQRRNHYPTRTFITVRPPTLAYIEAAFPNGLARRTALGVLTATMVAAWMWRLIREGASRWMLGASLLALGAGTTIGLTKAYLFHEDWAGLLIALSLALRRPDRWWLSLAIGLLAAFIRDLAAAYLLVMAVLAWRDGARGEAAAWFSALGAAAVALALHAMAVHAYTLPHDVQSQGWAKIGGWWFVLETLRWNAILLSLHPFVTAILTPFALVGLASWRGPLGERVALTVFGYCVAFLVFGRPENDYWGMLTGPIWPLGLVMAPLALRELARTLQGEPTAGENRGNRMIEVR